MFKVVRAAVICGLRETLEEPLSHPTLRLLLPLMKYSIHDISEKVRDSFVELLIKV